MRYLSVCSGIEAATTAWHGLGWTPVAFSEIEPFPCKVLAHHYPNVPNWGDMTKFKEWPDAEIDLLVGGTPCQSFSVAGLRKGLDDPRGNLMLTYLAIADKYRPKTILWENVPGVLSSNGGRDFGTFLGALGKLGYGYAYRVLDAQYVRTDGYPNAVPQRRRRVFVVGCLGDWGRAAAILFDSESVSGNPPPRRETGQTVAPTVRAGAANGGKGHGARSGDSKDELIVPVLRSYPCGGIGSYLSGDVSSPLLRTGADLGPGCETLIARSVALRGREGGSTAELGDDVGNTLRASSGGGDKPHVLCMSHGQANSEISVGFAPTLNCNHEQPLVYAMPGNWVGRSPANGGNATNPMVDVSPCQTKTDVHAVMSGMQVRRLTPLECERLQGFPDGWTNIPGASDTARYKALGNSMACNVMQLIGQRIDAL